MSSNLYIKEGADYKIIVGEPKIKNVWNNMVILLDNGHAKSTPGKRSPDSSFFEYEFNRDIVKRIAKKLDLLGIKYHILVPEVDQDIALSTRAARANNYARQYGASNCLLVSVHANAAGMGEWKNARGWCVFTTRGLTNSDKYATIFWEEANKLIPSLGSTMRADWSDGDPDWEKNFTVIWKTICPSLLTENLFYDNKQDLEILKSEKGRDTIAQIHVNAIKRICDL